MTRARMLHRAWLSAIAGVVAAFALASCTGFPATGDAAPPTTAANPTPTATSPTKVSSGVTLEQVGVIARAARRQGAVTTFSRTDPSGIVVVRPPRSRISPSSLQPAVKAAGDPLVQVVTASDGSRKQSLEATFRAYSRSHTRPGVYLRFRYDNDHHVFRLATNAPAASLTGLLDAYGEALVVTYASPGCLVCGG